MATVYFVRHAEANYHNYDDVRRELTEQGLRDRALVTDYLSDKGIDAVFSSPYRRAIETVRPLSETCGLPVQIVPDFRERRISGSWIEDFDKFSRRQWEDFSYKLPGGESLAEVQRRNVDALFAILEGHPDQRLVIGSHGTALSTVIRYFDETFGYEEFVKIKKLMPWIVRFTFAGNQLRDIKLIDVFRR